MSLTGEKRRDDKPIVGLFSIHDHKMFPQFHFTNSYQLSITTEQDTVGMRHGLSHFRAQPASSQCFFRDMGPSFIREPNGNPTLGDNAVDHITLT